MCGVLTTRLHQYQRQSDGKGKEELERELASCSQSHVAPVDDLQIIVDKAHSAETDQPEKSDPDKAVGQVRPQQGRHDHRNDYEQSSHCRCSCFFLVLLRPIFPDVLTYLELL